MTSLSIQSFDVTEHIRGKIREVLIGSIPDEQMDSMIKSEWNKFFVPGDGYYSRESPFASMVKREIEIMLKDHVKQWLDVNFKREWDEIGGSQKMIGDGLLELIPIVQKKIIVEISAQALAELRSRLG